MQRRDFIRHGTVAEFQDLLKKIPPASVRA
jgi:hypothetical protein